MLAFQPRKRFAKDTVLIVDGTLVPTRDHTIAERSKNYRYSTNHQVLIDAETRLVVVVGRPLAGNRNDCKAGEESGAKAAVGKTLTIADGGLPYDGRTVADAGVPVDEALLLRLRRRAERDGDVRGGRARAGGAVGGQGGLGLVGECPAGGSGAEGDGTLPLSGGAPRVLDRRSVDAAWDVAVRVGTFHLTRLEHGMVTGALPFRLLRTDGTALAVVDQCRRPRAERSETERLRRPSLR